MTSTNTLSWAEAWLQAMESISHPGRMRRGRQFARHNNIKRIQVEPGIITANVQDAKKKYAISIQIDPIDEASWQKIIEKLASQALYSAKLLAGEIPPAIVQVFDDAGVSLFPKIEQLTATCSCPDWETPCKHTAGVYYTLADKLEENPFLLFLLRGKTKEALLAALRDQRQQSESNTQEHLDALFVTPPLIDSIDNFWDIRPQANALQIDISPPAIPLPHLKRMPPPAFTHIDLSTLLSPIYETVTQHALTWAYQKSDKS